MDNSTSLYANKGSQEVHTHTQLKLLVLLSSSLKHWQSMMPYHNEASVVHPGRTGNYSLHTAAMEHSGRGGKTTTVINRALDTTLTTEVLWGYRHEQWSFTTTAALGLKIGTGSVNQFYTVSLDKIHKMPIAAEKDYQIWHFVTAESLSCGQFTNLVSGAVWVPPSSWDWHIGSCCRVQSLICPS